MDSVCKERCKPVRLLEHVVQEGNEVFTTGDSQLDNALGGGIRTGMVWEIVGERYVQILSYDMILIVTSAQPGKRKWRFKQL
jgi:DNA repair protein RAD57